MRPLRLIPGIHRVEETDLARHLRRVLSDPHILTYYHRGTNRWVIASWVSRSGNLVVEHRTVPSLHGPETTRTIRGLQAMKGTAALSILGELADEVRSQDLDDCSRRQMDAEQMTEWTSYLRKRARASDQNHPGWSWAG